MLENYYPTHSRDELETFIQSYIPLIKNQLKIFKIDLDRFGISGDHLGLQTISKEEFDLVHTQLISYSEIINEGNIHERRNNTYKLNEFIKCLDIEIQSIEIFEPKPTADISKLKPGIEHIAMKVDRFDELEEYFAKNKLPIDKSVQMNDSRFFKTKFINLVEIEFRNNYLWKNLHK